MGTLQAGGPSITTGTGGNVRYIRTQASSSAIASSAAAHSTSPASPRAVPFRYTDDSGTAVKVTPLPIIPRGQDTFNQVGLTVQTYGIRDKGGSVLTFVGTNSHATTINGIEQAAGILIDTGSTGGWRRRDRRDST